MNLMSFLHKNSDFFLMPISEIFNGDDFRFNFLMVSF